MHLPYILGVLVWCVNVPTAYACCTFQQSKFNYTSAVGHET